MSIRRPISRHRSGILSFSSMAFVSLIGGTLPFLTVASLKR